MKFIRPFSLLLGLFLIALSLWTNRFFGHVTVEQALSTINFGAHGILATDSIFIKRFIIWCLFWPSIIWISWYILFSKSLKVNVPVLTLSLGIVMFAYQYRIPDYLLSLQSHHSDLFQTVYVDPAKANIRTKQPKNLVWIYVESLEETYSNNSLFKHNLLEKLNSITADGVHFNHYQQIDGTGWTIAGLIATQCGIPLRMVTIFNGNRMGENINHYLPGATCLSDILSKQGYKNIFLKGASLKFSGVNVFLRDHHYAEGYGKEEWIKRGKVASNTKGWGLTDDQLFAQAKIRLAELIKDKQPFNLTILTVDTHGYDGTLNDSCRKKGYQDFTGIVECTADEVADFVAYIKSNGWLDRINVVIQGDHLAMENKVSDIIKMETNRTIYNVLISNNNLQKNTDYVVHYDMLPTILESLGFSFKDGKLGLGYSAIRHPASVAPANRITILSELASQSSASYNRLWSTKNIAKMQIAKQ